MEKRYIRTKDGIYQFKNNENICKKDNELFEIQRFFQPVDHINYKLLGKIQAEADTIEELCDCFVVVGKKHYIWDKQHCLGLTFEQVKQSYSAYDFEIYGAVWREWGLKYVAKMNENGDLELI